MTRFYTLENFERNSGNDSPGVRILDPDGETVMDNEAYYPYSPNPEDMRRICACLNYCEGISTIDLEKQHLLLHGPSS